MANVPPRVGEILFPILREALPSAQVVSWAPPIRQRDYPLILVRRIGGSFVHPEFADRPMVDIQNWDLDSPAAAEDTALTIRAAIWQAFKDQRVVDGKGSIASVRESKSLSLIGDPGEKAWRFQQIHRIIIRPTTS